MSALRGLAYDHDALPETCHEDGHIDGCPGRAGGDHELAFRYSRAPKTQWCWLCRRATDGSRMVDTTDVGTVAVCEECWSTVSPMVPLDMTEEEPFENREGMPEFNGAFDRW